MNVGFEKKSKTVACCWLICDAEDGHVHNRKALEATCPQCAGERFTRRFLVSLTAHGPHLQDHLSKYGIFPLCRHYCKQITIEEATFYLKQSGNPWKEWQSEMLFTIDIQSNANDLLIAI